MSIVCRNEDGWVICHKTFLNQTYSRCLDDNASARSLAVKSAFFEMNTPILMNSQAAKHANAHIHGCKSNIKTKRKRKKVSAKEEPFHDEVATVIKQKVDCLLENARSLNHFKQNEVSSLEWLENNTPAKNAAKEILGTGITQRSIVTFNGENQGDQPVIHKIEHEVYVIPPRSTFIQSDIRNLHSLSGTYYDLILIDVPWKNKSVKRKNGYAMIKCDTLLSLPIPQLTRSNSVVCVWATNNKTQINFIKESLFPHWGVQHCADWHWVKVTTRGDFIHSIDSSQNKPFENLIIGHVASSGENVVFFEPNKIFVSIPSSIHSHKPPLSEILKTYLPKNATCLELFARYLIPNWTSYGNEVLKLQNLKMFDECQNDQTSKNVPVKHTNV